MVFVGMLPWFLFSTILSEASESLVSNANLVGKVYFPRLIIPASSAVVALVDFAINSVILLALMIWYGLCRLAYRVAASFRAPGRVGEPGTILPDYGAQRQIPRLPLHHPFHRAVRPLCFAGRVFEPGGPGRWRFWYSLNPVVGVIDGFRWCVLGGDNQSNAGLPLSLVVIALFLWLGIRLFPSTERTFADLIDGRRRRHPRRGTGKK